MKKIIIFTCFLCSLTSLNGMQKNLEKLTVTEIVNYTIDLQNKKIKNIEIKIEELQECIKILTNKLALLEELYNEDYNYIFNEITNFLKSSSDSLNQEKLKKILLQIKSFLTKKDGKKIIDLEDRIKRLEKKRNPKFIIFTMILCSYVLFRYLEHLVYDYLSKCIPTPS
ncbi:hypothetical protein GF385_02295 [Candidatus Dependentiae bacterium]|nr:hypothetical protein [Candidatus Dependentiae bacterium]